jgi:hypothetical protein
VTASREFGSLMKGLGRIIVSGSPRVRELVDVGQAVKAAIDEELEQLEQAEEKAAPPRRVRVEVVDEGKARGGPR